MIDDDDDGASLPGISVPPQLLAAGLLVCWSAAVPAAIDQNTVLPGKLRGSPNLVILGISPAFTTNIYVENKGFYCKPANA